MIQVGVRELKSGLSGYLRRVGRGEHVRVTIRGRPIADLVPPGGTPRSPLEDLVDAGRVQPSAGEKPPQPPRLRQGPSASAKILAEREEGR